MYGFWQRAGLWFLSSMSESCEAYPPGSASTVLFRHLALLESVIDRRRTTYNNSGTSFFVL